MAEFHDDACQISLLLLFYVQEAPWAQLFQTPVAQGSRGRPASVSITSDHIKIKCTEPEQLMKNVHWEVNSFQMIDGLVQLADHIHGVICG